MNGQQRPVDVMKQETLVMTLRYKLGLTGTKIGCDTSSCGACTVLLNGQSVKSCTVLAAQADGAEVTTIEGLADGENLHPVQQAWLDCDVAQCGFCQPGMMLSARALLDKTPKPSDAQLHEAMSGVLCRCFTHQRMIRAIKRYAEKKV